MKIIQELIESQNNCKAAEARLTNAKMQAVEYIKDCGYDKVELDGYSISLKEYKRQAYTTDENISKLEDELAKAQQRLADNNAVKIYDLQQQIYNLRYELHSIVNNDETKILEDLIKTAKEELKKNTNNKLDVVVKFNAKSANLLKYVDERQYKDLIVSGKKAKENCGKSIGKAAVASFIIGWAYTPEEVRPSLKEAWELRLKEHTEYWKNKGA